MNNWAVRMLLVDIKEKQTKNKEKKYEQKIYEQVATIIALTLANSI